MNEKDILAAENFARIYENIQKSAPQDAFCRRICRGTTGIFSYKSWLTGYSENIGITFSDDLVLIKTKNLLKAQIAKNLNKTLQKTLAEMKKASPLLYGEFLWGCFSYDPRDIYPCIYASDDGAWSESETRPIWDVLTAMRRENGWNKYHEFMQWLSSHDADMYRKMHYGTIAFPDSYPSLRVKSYDLVIDTRSPRDIIAQDKQQLENDLDAFGRADFEAMGEQWDKGLIRPFTFILEKAASDSLWRTTKLVIRKQIFSDPNYLWLFEEMSDDRYHSQRELDYLESDINWDRRHARMCDMTPEALSSTYTQRCLQYREWLDYTESVDRDLRRALGEVMKQIDAAFTEAEQDILFLQYKGWRETMYP